MIFDKSGNLYGTTQQGGPAFCGIGDQGGCGMVFELSPGSGGTWTETTLHEFTGGDDGGLVFKLSPAVGNWTTTILHVFTGKRDGSAPWGGVIFGSAGNLYGATWYGGKSLNCQGSGCGTIFKLSPSGLILDGDCAVFIHRCGGWSGTASRRDSGRSG